MKKKILAIFCVCILLFSAVACAEKRFDYNYERTSENNMLKFESSDKELDHFLNDFLHRHLRYDDYSIGDGKLGESVVFNKEYEALSLLWFDTTENALGAGDDRFELVMQTIDDIPVDDYGYVWSAFNHLESTTAEAGALFAQGWPFPHYGSSEGESVGFEFNRDQEGWTTNVLKNNCTGGVFSVTAYKEDMIEFISPVFDYPVNTFHAPFIHMDMRMTDRAGIGANTTIDDIRIYFRQYGQDSFPENQYVSYNDFSTISNPIRGNFAEKFYFPMYVLPEWKDIVQVKIVVVPKEGEKLSVNADLNYFRMDYDARQSTNNALILDAAKTMFEYTGDVSMLERNMTRFRKMILFMTHTLKGESGLLDIEYFIGHEGVGGELGRSIGNGYFDIFSAPETGFYANIYFLRAIESMAYLEKVAEEAELDIDKAAASVRAPYAKNSDERVFYTWDSDSLAKLAEKVKESIQRDIKPPVQDENGKYHHNPDSGFWDPAVGRFIEGYNAEGKKMDYGFVAYNLEAIASGISTQEQSASIMQWIDGERIVEGDLAQGKLGKGFGGSDPDKVYGIYDLQFAPRTTTVKNSEDYVWGWAGGTVGYGDQVQDGGGLMFTSYYDLMSRVMILGADNAYGRLKEIQKWYNDVEAAAQRAGVGISISNQEFYRSYYREKGVQMQGGGTAGGIGLDYEFLESALMYASIPMGFFGISSEKISCLKIEPNFPSALDYWKMENLRFYNINYDLSIGNGFVQIDSVRGDTRGKSIKIVLDCNEKQKVYVNGEVASSVTVADGRASLQVPFEACKIEVY